MPVSALPQQNDGVKGSNNGGSDDLCEVDTSTGTVDSREEPEEVEGEQELIFHDAYSNFVSVYCPKGDRNAVLDFLVPRISQVSFLVAATDSGRTSTTSVRSVGSIIRRRYTSKDGNPT